MTKKYIYNNFLKLFKLRTFISMQESYTFISCSIINKGVEKKNVEYRPEISNLVSNLDLKITKIYK